MHTTLMLLGALFAIAGCNSPPPEQTVFDPNVRALKKAKAVEGQLQHSAEQRREQAEAAVAPTPGPDSAYDYR